MQGPVRLRPNTPMVISEIVEDEVVLVNFDTGSYYSLRGSGTQVWQALEAGAGREEVLGALLAHFGGTTAEIESAALAFLEELLREELIVEDGTAAVISGPGERGIAPFVPPTLERFDDMRDMLLLDPIHEVDEAGWPHAAPGNT